MIFQRMGESHTFANSHIIPLHHIQHLIEPFRHILHLDRFHAGVRAQGAARLAAGGARVRRLDEEVAPVQRAVDRRTRRPPEAQRRQTDGGGDMQGAGVGAQEDRRFLHERRRLKEARLACDGDGFAAP